MKDSRIFRLWQILEALDDAVRGNVNVADLVAFSTEQVVEGNTILDELEAELAAHKAVDQINTVRVQKGEPVTVGIPGKHWRRK